VGEVEALADVAVGQPVGGHPSDLQFLGGDAVPCVWGAAAARLTRGAQFLAGLVGPRAEPMGVEPVAGCPQGGTRDSVTLRCRRSQDPYISSSRARSCGHRSAVASKAAAKSGSASSGAAGAQRGAAAPAATQPRWQAY
jgi:hypothetical protein